MGDIQPGDMVVCVAPEFNDCPNVARHRRFATGPSRLRTGGIYTVTGFEDRMGEIGLLIAGIPGSFCAGRFRKIDAADEQFTALIRACKPINSPVPA